MICDCSDLSSVTSLKQVILNSFSPPSEEVKSAASYTLGSVAVGNLPQYLPFVLQEIEAQPKRQYLLLHSLKEVGEVVQEVMNREAIYICIYIQLFLLHITSHLIVSPEVSYC